MAVPVTIFNANQASVQVQVNGGTQFTIAGTGPSQNWQPQQPNPNPLSFNNGYPAANVFGTLAPNQVVLYSGGSPISQPLSISIPQTQVVNSLQLYFFFGTTTTVSWVMLNSGQPIAWGTNLSTTALKSAASVKAPRGGSKKASKKR
ncbi:MAG: hypothetical protein AUG51_09270 [Acidobacteria bacterium 13_1_20CM_3_53_8]|nr:MAG: hypothetical protein AUG51_09270 [Acidobacteria bacterium 13_1_20CM_3_53_8]